MITNSIPSSPSSKLFRCDAPNLPRQHQTLHNQTPIVDGPSQIQALGGKPLQLLKLVPLRRWTSAVVSSAAAAAAMSIYSSPPLSRASFSDDKPALLVCWWCTSFAATIIMFRVTGRYIRTEKLFKEDWLAFACLIPLSIRMAFVHLVILYGTNNMTTSGVSDEILQQRILGSRLVLGSRVFYAAT